MPLFGPGRPAPQLDAQGHHYDPNSPTPYDAGPAHREHLTDPYHPDYDPAIDPNLQLRTVRTAAESIAESHRSEQRRDDRAKLRRAKGPGGSILGKLGRGRTLLRRNTTSKHGSGGAAVGTGGGVLHGMIENEWGSRKHVPMGGAMGTGGEGVGVPFESAQQDTTPAWPTQEAQYRAEQEAHHEASIFEDDEGVLGQDATAKPAEAAAADAAPLDTGMKKRKKKSLARRNVYCNATLLPQDVDKKGEPKARYARNKVRTSKYTVVTFLPRFLGEQFQRLANIYFLLLIVLQVFPYFGATIPQIAMLPLVFILTITAIKDSIEDYRRHVLDNQVNNSAITRLGNWRNVNQPKESRGFFARLFGAAGKEKVSKGVRKLREKEDAIGLSTVRGGGGAGSSNMPYDAPDRPRAESLTSAGGYGGGNLETIASESERSYGMSKSMSMSRGTTGMGASGPGASTASFGVASARSISGNNNAAPQGVVDYRRNVAGTGRWERTLWKKLEVGDVVLLRENDQVPADIVCLNSSDPDGNCFIETKNLDGETNLKARKCVKATMGIQTEEDVEHARFIIDSEPPHANLYAYNALLKYSAPASSDEYGDAGAGNAPHAPQQARDSKRWQQKVEPVGINELLLRGCAIRNTEWVIGIVVFTGADTKIMLNGGETPSKRSKIEKETNVNVAVNFLLLMLMCSACAIIGGLILKNTGTSRDFYEPGALDSSSDIVNAFIIFGSCLVLFQNIVPISLYISIELTKTIAAFFIYQDIDMYYAPLDHPCVPKTWGIVDDLGQIEYIFSDKTGTLTQNVMEFKKCSINGHSYGEGITEAMIGAMKRDGKDTSHMGSDAQRDELEAAKQSMIDKMNRTFKNRYLREEQLTLISPSMADELGPNSPTGPDQRRNIIAFFRALALCHTALADRPVADSPYTLEYKAQSPDEAALVAAARDVGAVFINKNNTAIDIEVVGQPERYTPLKVLEFNSTRKRMSVIVREPDGRLLMICKGADSVIYQRLRADHDARMKEVTQRDLEDFANAGLRTLCIAYRYLEEREYAEWARIHDEAAASLTDRDDLIDEACEKIEIDLTLLGATALEDKLQVGVPETIEKLHQAGIKLWILTGDKLQTAIEIGFSCNLLSSTMEIMIISADHEAGTRAMIEAACNKIAAAGRPVIVEKMEKRAGIMKKTSHRLDVERTEDAPVGGFAVVIDGETLRYALDPNLKPLFLALTTLCETVVCCRVSPAQKALTVKLVKDGKNAMTLSIGDGANDVSMIQEAHIGVGIAGLEGAQASMSADYAIGQFRYLAKLLLVHGHWNTYRIGVLHQVFFYKNLIWTGALLIFQIWAEADATYLFDYGLILLYNLVFTSLPVVILGALDQDVRAAALMAYPQTYNPGREGKLYTRGQFWFACLDGAYQAAVCFLIAWAAWFYFPIVTATGLSLDPITAMGTTVAASCVVSANFYAGLAMQSWSVFMWVAVMGSNLAFFAWIALYSLSFWGTTFSGTAFVLFGTVQFWATILVSVILCMLPRYTHKAWCQSFRPTEVDIVRQGWIAGDIKQRLGLREDETPKGRTPRSGEKGAYSDAAHGSVRDAENGNSGYGGQQRYRETSSGSHSDTSVSPLPTNYEERYGRRNAPPVVSVTSPAGQQQYGDSPYQQQEAIRSPMRTGAGTAMSFYDPDALPTDYADSPDAPKRGQSPYGPHSQGPTGFGAPQINVQRASGSSFQYAQHQDATTSRSALAANQSTASFDAAFDDAFGDERRDGDAGDTSPPVRTPSRTGAQSPAERFHNRFAPADQPPLPAASPTGIKPTSANNEHLDRPAHAERENSNMTQASWHTAERSHDVQQSPPQW